MDYDNDRDFNANNDIQVYYEGLEDEIVRRIEVGTVTFQPARSRFITAAIPSNNFGVNARFEVGQVQIQALAATQKGSQVAERTYTVGQTTSQAQDRQLRDLDFESGRFFWVVDPTILPGYPALDILDLSRAAPPPSERPVQVRVYRFRPDLTQSGANSNVTGITALARTTDPNQSYGPVRWELLVQGTDYYLDPSGLWFGLASKLDQNDYLAVSYVTADGRTVGSMPVEDRGPGSTDSLRLIVQPRTGPEAVTFRHEMRQIYRVAGNDLDAASLQVGLSVNRSERPQNGTPTYLSLLGLSIPTDPNLFDIENRLFPRPSRDPEAVQVVRESFVVFPHLTPFADATKLTPSERADSMYRTPLYALLQQTGAKFNVRLRYNSTGAGDRSTLTLGALQLREGSEQLIVRGRRLERGVDYTITYDVGQVTFLNPDALFGSQPTQVTARFEEQGVFAVAPTSILGLSTTYSLGDRGEINLIGMYQREQSAFNRPQLGLEASANLVAGANTELRFKPQGITRLLNRLTSTPTTAPSAFDVNGEFAFTKPDPNRSGQAYLEEFEGDAGVPVSLRESSWEFGSRPQSGDGLADLGFGGGFDPEDAVAMTWQNLVPTADGTAAFELRPEDIDTLIKVTGSSEQRETVLFMTLHADTAGGVVRNDGSSDSRWTLPRRDFRPRWRTMVIPLSSTGLDLTRNEFLEFWVFQPPSRTADSAGVRLALDIGTVDEDAIALAPTTLNLNDANDSTFTGRQYVGLGRLDTERRSIGTFNAETDDIGILGDLPDGVVDGQTGETLEPIPLCQSQLSSTVAIFPWGDLSSRCTRGNGVLDSEDLNGDNGLNSGGVNRQRLPLRGEPAAGQQVFRADRDDRRLAALPDPDPPARRHDRHPEPPTGAAPAVAGRRAARSRHARHHRELRAGAAPVRRLAMDPSLGSADRGLLRLHQQPRRRGRGVGHLHREPDRSGVRAAAGRRRRAGPSERRSSGVQVNEKSLRIIGRQLSVGDRAEALPPVRGGPPERAGLPHASRLGARERLRLGGG